MITTLAARLRGDRELGALVYVDDDAVRRIDAGSADEAVGTGPLAGRAVVVKDNVAVTGAPHQCGSPALADREPAGSDADVVRRIRADGGVVVGTTNLDELAMGASTETSAAGPTRNPHDGRRTAGGSSGGSAAAVAAHDLLGVGTDTGGSIREPAAFCGVVGVAPSPGTVPTAGVMPFAPSMDRVGPLARRVADAALLHESMAGTTGLVRAASTRVLHGWRVAVVAPMAGERNDPEVRAVFTDAVERLRMFGAVVGTVPLPRFGDLLDVYLAISSVEALPVLDAFAPTGRLGAEAASRREIGHRLAGTEEVAGYRRIRAQIGADATAVFADCEVMVSPTVPLVAPLLGRSGMADPLARPRTDWWTVEANLAGLAAGSVPIGRADGLPVGLQVMAPGGRDERVYAVAGAVEATFVP